MRNWNLLHDGLHELLFSVISLPMRNWNLSAQPNKGILSSLLVYLWGIETLQASDRAGGKGNVISLPMRNWNGFRHSKLEYVEMVISLPMRNWNSMNWLVFRRFYIVISLPMRNWNWGIATILLCHVWLLVYLWGIETPTTWPPFCLLAMLLVYLWGIETIEKEGQMFPFEGSY